MSTADALSPTAPAQDASRASAPPALALADATIRIGDTVIVGTVSCSFRHGEVTALIGQNGSGKSTLLRALARQHPLASGTLLLDGRPIESRAGRAFAREVAYLPQHLPVAHGMSVRELVSLGRYPWHGALGRFSSEDGAQVDRALEISGTLPYADRSIDHLSGGERQRCWLAMLLAQQANVMLLDEPISALDIRHQVDVLRLIGRVAASEGASVVVVIHDVNLAARYCDRIIALRDGRVVMDGPPEALMAPEALREIYDASMSVVTDPVSGERFAYASDPDALQRASH